MVLIQYQIETGGLHAHYMFCSDVLENTQRPRPLMFDAEQHKILNSELKHLYTATTRARVNVWLFDEDQDIRAPMFEYWKALGLVRTVKSQVVEGAAAEVGVQSQTRMYLYQCNCFERFMVPT